MAERELKLRIGASIDANFNSVMSAVKESQKRAAREVAQEAKRAAKEASDAQKKAIKETEDAAKRAAKEVERTAKQSAKAEVEARRQAVRDQQNALKTLDQWQKRALKDRLGEEKRVNTEVARNVRERVRLEREAMREVERDLKQHMRNRANEEAKGGGSGSGGGPIGRRTFGDRLVTGLALRASSAALAAPTRFVGSMLRGMGVETGLESHIRGATEREKMAMNIANNAWMPQGGGPAGSTTRRDPAAIQRMAMDTGIATGLDGKDVLGGIQKFVALTGDLKTMEESMGDLAKLSKANGAEFEDMAEAAGNISNAMGDIPNKGKAINDVLRVLAGQGQMTAIEIKDQAKNIGMLTAQSNFFKIDPLSAKTLAGAGVTDEAGQRIASVSALAQMARSKGGRVTAKTAMQSAMAFMRDLANPLEVKRMYGAGIDVYADSSHTKVRDPLQMMLEVFRKGQGKGGVNRDVINRLLPNQQSRAVVNAFSQTYNDAYEQAAKKGITQETERHKFAMMAVTEEYQKMLGMTQKNTQIETAFGEAMKTTDSKTKILNNQFGKVADILINTFAPALTDVINKWIMPAAQAFAGWADTILNPGKDVDKGVEASNKAYNAFGDIRAGIQGKTFDPEKFKAAQEANKALDVAVGKKYSETTELAKPFSGPGGDKFDQKIYDKFLSGAAGEANKELAVKYKTSVDSLQSMQDTQKKLSNAIDEMNRLHNEKKLKDVEPQKVIIVEDKTNRPGATPKTPGTMNPDASH